MNINVAALVAYLAATFLVCGIPFGKIIARAKGVDIQHVGSGNIGTTNVAREIGKGAAALTLLFDAGKGALATGLAGVIFPLCVTGGVSVDPQSPAAALVGLVMLAAVCGHIFSPFLGFHGGKGIAVGFGAALGLWWPVALGLLAVFLVFAVPSRYVSLGSVCAAASLPIQCALWGFPLVSVAPIVVVALVVIWAHRSNIRKLARGEERRFAFHKDGEKPDATDGPDQGGTR